MSLVGLQMCAPVIVSATPACGLSSCVLHLLVQRHRLSSYLVEPVLVKLPNFVATHTEDLAYRGVACIRCMVAVGDEATVLKLDYVVNLCLCEVLHILKLLL